MSKSRPPPSHHTLLTPTPIITITITTTDTTDTTNITNITPQNQDSLIMADDEATNSLVLCVLDGHGEAGDGVSQHFKKELAKEMFSHPSWSGDPKKATRDSILKVEQQVRRIFEECEESVRNVAVAANTHNSSLTIRSSATPASIPNSPEPLSAWPSSAATRSSASTSATLESPSAR